MSPGHPGPVLQIGRWREDFANQALLLIAVLGLYWSTTNFVYLSALPALFCAMAVPVVYSRLAYVHRFVLFTILFYGYCLASTLVYAPSSLLTFGYYRYDGNFVVSFLPLLVLPFMRLRADTGRLLTYFLYVVTFVNGIVLLHHLVFRPYPLFHGLFYAHNAAGGFFALVIALALTRALAVRTFPSWLLFWLNVTFLIATGSRGSILGLFCALVAFWGIRRGWWFVVRAGFLSAALATAAVLWFTYPIFLESTAVGAVFGIDDRIADLADEGRTANVLQRALSEWPRGLHHFLASPWVGSGFGSVNDAAPYEFRGIEGYLALREPQEMTLDSSHAHHSYLHMLGEVGIFGTALFLMIFKSLFDFLVRQTAIPWLRDTLIICLLTICFSGFTEHRMTTPAMMIPFTLLVGLYAARLRQLRWPGEIVGARRDLVASRA